VSSENEPMRRAAFSIWPLWSKTRRAAAAVNDAGRTPRSSESPARFTISRTVTLNSCFPRLLMGRGHYCHLEVFVQLLDLFVTLSRGAGINRDLLPVRRTVEVNIIATGDL
jgi:hypothetical protein